jgi:hypothetical protein
MWQLACEAPIRIRRLPDALLVSPGNAWSMSPITTLALLATGILCGGDAGSRHYHRGTLTGEPLLSACAGIGPGSHDLAREMMKALPEPEARRAAGFAKWHCL